MEQHLVGTKKKTNMCVICAKEKHKLHCQKFVITCPILSQTWKHTFVQTVFACWSITVSLHWNYVAQR